MNDDWRMTNDLTSKRSDFINPDGILG